MSSLISAKELSNRIADPNLIIIDCRFDLGAPEWGKQDYLSAHIPRAIYADLNENLSSPVTPHSGRHPLPESDNFLTFLSQIGVDNEKTVVVYDTTSGSYAARLWWLLRSYNHDSVYLLNGGFQAWKEADYPLESGNNKGSPGYFEGRFSDDYCVDTHFVEKILDDPDYLLIDARSPNRYSGEDEPIDSVAGHIPGAINIFHQQNLDSKGYFLSPEKLKELYQVANLTDREENIILYCGSGVTSCVNLFALAEIGIDRARLYAGSWSEWIRDASRPKITPDEN